MVDDTLQISTTDAAGQTSSQTLFMSYGLLNELVRLAGDPTRASTIDIDPDLAQTVLFTVLLPRDPTGRSTVGSGETYVPPGVTVNEAYKIFDWVREHLLDFFAKRLQASLQSIEGRKEQLAQIGSSLDGLKASVSKT